MNENIECSRCHQKGHTMRSKKCPIIQAEKLARNPEGLRTCRACGQPGHNRRNKKCKLNFSSD